MNNLNVILRKYKLAALYFFIGVALYTGGQWIENYLVREGNDASLIKRFEKIFNKKEKLLDEILDQVIKYENADKQIFSQEEITKLSKINLAVLVYHNDSLVFWSDNSFKIPEKSNEIKQSVVFLQNAWYFIKSKHTGNKTVVGLILLKNKFNYENQFLKNEFPKADIAVRSLMAAGKLVGVAIDTDAQESGEIKVLTDALEERLGLEKEDYGVEIMGSSLGNSFFKQTIVALLIAFLLMGVVVFLYFRTLAPSLAVMLAAFSDIIVTLAIFNLTGMKLGTAGVAAFLMLIGYSVDTDVLLSTRVLKRKEGTVMERVLGAMKTGLTMSCTTLTAVVVALIFVESEVIEQIMVILLIGLLVDLVMTWIQNVGILRIYLEKKRKE